MRSLRPIVSSLILMSCALAAPAADLEVGIIGLDTSHVIAFTQLLNDSGNPDHVPGARVVVAFKGGSPDVESSASRVDGFTRRLAEEFGVRIVPTIQELCEQVDAVMIESVDGRPHLAQARPVIAAGKPLFIDKPLAGSLADALEIFRLAREAGVPIFTSSAYRYYDSLVELKAADVGVIKGAISYGPAHLEPHHPDLFWYGVHAVEALFAVLGSGCESVTRVATPDTDVVTGVWSGGRIGTMRGLRNAATPHRVILFGEKGVAEQRGGGDSYVPLVREIVRFFQTGRSPIPARETIEMFAFMEAADESKRRGGVPVRIEEWIALGRAR